MAEIKTINGQSVIDYMARDYDSLLQSMRELIPTKLPEWQEFAAEADFGNVLLQLFAHLGDLLSYYQDRIANESFLGTAQTRRSIIHHLRLIGYRLATATPASTTLTVYVPVACDQTVTITRGDAFATKSQKDKPSVRFEYNSEMPLAIDCSSLPIDPVTNKKYFVGIPVEEGRLIKDELLGVSDGSPNQKFLLAHSGLILRSLGKGQEINRDIILITELGATIEEWTLQESLAFGRENQKDFVIEIDEDDRAAVIFGDGAFGAIPLHGASIKVTYRVGGGKHGNVAADTIQTIVNAPQLAILGAQVANRKHLAADGTTIGGAATGGADRESIAHAVQHAPSVFRSLKRAVTTEDYEALALDFKGVGKVRAEATNWNTVTLFVAPEGGGQVSDVLEANLLAYFEDKRAVSTIIEISDVDYVQIYITAAVGVASYYSEDVIHAQVKEAAGELLDFENVDFGRTIYLSKFYEKIEAIEGVDYVTITEFSRVKNSKPFVEPEGKIVLGHNEIAIVPDKLEYPDYVDGIKVVPPQGDN